MRYAFVYTSGRRARLGGSFPTELFYGAVELGAEIIEEADLDARGGGPLGLVASKLVGLDVTRVARLWASGARARFAGLDAVVTTSNHLGLQLAALRIRPRILAIVMGILPEQGARPGARLLRRLLGRTTVVSISRGEQAWLEAQLGLDVRYLPFGVDHAFWVPGTPGDYALSVGNDPHRDYETLAQAWRPSLPPLRIVTRRKLPPLPANASVIEGDWRDRVLSDEALRILVQGAAFVVVPLRATVQPSGQSVTLQAMACGRPVILTDTRGLWDRALMRHGENCLLVRPGSARDLADAAATLAGDAALRERLGAAGRRTVEEHFSAARMAAALRELLEQPR